MHVRRQTSGGNRTVQKSAALSPAIHPATDNPLWPGGALPMWSLTLLLAACGGGGGAPQTTHRPEHTYSDPFEAYWAVGLAWDYDAPVRGYAQKPHPGTSTNIPDNIQPLPAVITAYKQERFDVYENHPVHKPVLDIGKQIERASLPEEMGDNSLFSMDESGRIFFREAPDFETRYDHEHGPRPGQDNHYHLYIQDGVTDRFIHAEIVIHDLVSERAWREGLNRAPEHDRPAYNVRRDDIRPEHQPQETTEDAPIGIHHVISGWVWAIPTSGPLVLTWWMLINRAFAEIEKAANLRFVEVDENNYGMGHLRFRFDPSGPVNHAYLPGNSNIHTTAQFGIRLIAEENHDTMFGVILHEIGHALGLQHTYDSGYGWSESPLEPTLPSIPLTSPDRYFPAAHSATSVPYSPILSKTDIAALQYMYGAPGSNDSGIVRKLTPAARQAVEQKEDGFRPPVETDVLPRGEPATAFSLSVPEVRIAVPWAEQKLADVMITDDGIGVNTPFFAPMRRKVAYNHETQKPSLVEEPLIFREMLEFRFEGGQWSLWLVPVRNGFEDWVNSFKPEFDPGTGKLVQRHFDLDIYLASSGGTPQEPSQILTTRLRIILEETADNGGAGAPQSEAASFLPFDQAEPDMQSPEADIL